jgi:hypothetical protein
MITTRFGICVVMIDAMTIAMPVESPWKVEDCDTTLYRWSQSSLHQT